MSPGSLPRANRQANRQANQLRIIGGRWRGRRLGFSSIPGLRPTPDRVRETLFNWLGQDLAGATTLDLFAGSGVLTCEALPRAAAPGVAARPHAAIVRSLAATTPRLRTAARAPHCAAARGRRAHRDGP